jgi:mannitol-1-phosphate/altronate dehydrogenase
MGLLKFHPAIGALAAAVTIKGDTHIGMLAEKPKDTEQYTTTQMSKFAKMALSDVVQSIAQHADTKVAATTLVEFASAVDALSAAIEFQQAMAEANADQPAIASVPYGPAPGRPDRRW